MATVRLLTDGGYHIPEVVGKTVEAERCIGFKGYNIRILDLIPLGATKDDWDGEEDTLYFYAEEVEEV